MRRLLACLIILGVSVLAAIAVAEGATTRTATMPSTTTTAPTSSTTTPTSTTTTPSATSPTTTTAPPTGPIQNVIVDNDHAGTVDARAGLQVARAGAHDASPENFARANAHDCTTPCQAISAALQIVLVPSGATTAAPQNVALATNIKCPHCGSFAYAYQYVVEIARGVRLSGHAHQQIIALRREADADIHAGLDYPTLDARLHNIAVRFRAVVDNDLTGQHVGEQHKQSFQTVKPNPPQ